MKKASLRSKWEGALDDCAKLEKARMDDEDLARIEILKLLNIDLLIFKTSVARLRCLRLLCGSLMALCTLPYLANAQTTLRTSSQVESQLKMPRLKTSDVWNVESRLSLQNESFVSADYNSTPQKSFMFMGASVTSRPEDRADTPLHLDVKGLFSPDSPVLSTFNISELYYTDEHFAVGRKKLNWSQGDEDWNLGLMQPQYRWNVLRPQSQGLTGVFVHLGRGEKQGWNLNLFGTPLFIPDQGAGYQLSNGRFQKVSPWFQAMPQEVAIAGSQNVRRIDYQVDVPQLEKIVMNSGYAANLSFEEEGVPYKFGASLAYKPRNVLSMGIDGWGEAGGVAPVVIVPSVSYHRIATADFETRGGPIEWRLGTAYEVSEEPRDQRADLTYALYRPMTVTSTSLGYLTDNYEARAFLIHRQGGELYAEGPKSQSFMEVLPQRIPYKDAAAIELKARPWRSGPRSLEFATRWTEGISESYSRWTLDASLRMNSQWTIWTDIVFVRAEKTPGADPDVFADFENHDSIRTGVSYAF